MIRILDGRGTGQTGRLMLLAKENGAKIACSNPHAMAEKARAYGIVGVDFISYRDLMTMGIQHGNVFIDEVEPFLQWCLSSNATLQGYCISVED